MAGRRIAGTSTYWPAASPPDISAPLLGSCRGGLAQRLGEAFQRDLGIAGVVAAVLATKGATWAFAVGVALCILIYGRRFFSGENDQTFTKDNDEETQ